MYSIAVRKRWGASRHGPERARNAPERARNTPERARNVPEHARNAPEIVQKAIGLAREHLSPFNMSTKQDSL